MAKANESEILESMFGSEGNFKDFEVVGVTNELEQVLSDFMEHLKKNFIADGHETRNSNLIQSLGTDDEGNLPWTITKENGVISIKIWLPDYYQYTDTGRLPTKKGGNGQVQKSLGFGSGGSGWIASKKLVPASGMNFTQKWTLKDGTVKSKVIHKTSKEANKILSFLISRKIHKEGFRNRKTGQNGTKWFTRAVPSFENQIAEALGVAVGSIQINLEVNGKKWQ